MNLLSSLREQGEAMATAARLGDPQTPIPTCPEWNLRQLVRHVGFVHRWATGIVGQAQAVAWNDRDLINPGGWPPDEQLVDWFADGVQSLLATLESAPEDLQCWTFFGSAQPKAFWTRRMAHETAIHRMDTQMAFGEAQWCDPEFCADGIDELMTMFVHRADRGPTAPRHVSVKVQTTDSPKSWRVVFGPEGAKGEQSGGSADCTVSGPAHYLYPYVWNRLPLGDLQVEGDPQVLELWRRNSSF